MRPMATAGGFAATAPPQLTRCQLYTVALLCAWQPINVLRHAPNLPSAVVAHFGVDGVALATLPFGLFAAMVSAGTLLLGAAVVGLADRAARRRESHRWTWNAQLRAERVGECAARAQFWLGVLAVLWLDLLVWAVLEANEEVPVALPAASGCVPCAVFIPVYLASVAGRRWLWALAGLGGGWALLLALPWLAGRRRADGAAAHERTPIMLPYEEF
jgi:hypothetical protein